MDSKMDEDTRYTVTRHFTVSGDDVLPMHRWGNDNLILIQPTRVTLTWTWHPDSNDDEKCLDVAVFGLRVLKSGALQREPLRPLEITWRQSIWPTWLWDLIHEYDDHGEPVAGTTAQ